MFKLVFFENFSVIFYFSSGFNGLHEKFSVRKKFMQGCTKPTLNLALDTPEFLVKSKKVSSTRNSKHIFWGLKFIIKESYELGADRFYFSLLSIYFKRDATKLN